MERHPIALQSNASTEARVWPCAQARAPVIVFLPAMGTRASFYDTFGQIWARFQVVAWALLGSSRRRRSSIGLAPLARDASSRAATRTTMRARCAHCVCRSWCSASPMTTYAPASAARGLYGKLEHAASSFEMLEPSQFGRRRVRHFSWAKTPLPVVARIKAWWSNHALAS